MIKIVLERWKKVPELKHIKVSSLGRVKINGKLIKPKISTNGYFVVEALDKYYFVHRLVAKAFLKHNLDKYETIDHLDSNRRNNAVSNLEIVSQQENWKRANDNLAYASLEWSPNSPDWRIRISDGKREFTTLKKACNTLINETGWSKEKALQDILGAIMLGTPGSRKWHIVNK